MSNISITFVYLHKNINELVLFSNGRNKSNSWRECNTSKLNYLLWNIMNISPHLSDTNSVYYFNNKRTNKVICKHFMIKKKEKREEQKNGIGSKLNRIFVINNFLGDSKIARKIVFSVKLINASSRLSDWFKVRKKKLTEINWCDILIRFSKSSDYNNLCFFVN